MIFSDHILMRIGILVLGLCGFWVARHIREHKIKGNPLVCPIRFDCNTVVNSDYSSILGIPVELLGMAYYALVFFSSAFFLFLPDVLPSVVVNIMILVSSSAFLFSAYLIAVQIFILKKGCSWCIVSSLISFSIFALTILI
jgi:uncharacterized membrane protein